MTKNIVLLLVTLSLITGCDHFLQGCTSKCSLDQDTLLLNDLDEAAYILAYREKYKDMKHDEPYMIETDDNHPPIVAFPIKRKQKGYVVILTRSKGGHTVKMVPVNDFELTKEVYVEIKKQVLLSHDIDALISSHVRSDFNLEVSPHETNLMGETPDIKRGIER